MSTDGVAGSVRGAVAAGEEALGERAVGDHNTAVLLRVRNQVAFGATVDQAVTNLVREHRPTERGFGSSPARKRVVADANLADKAYVLKCAHAAHRRLLAHERVGLMHLVEVESADPEPLRAGDAALLDDRRQGQQREQLCREEDLLLRSASAAPRIRSLRPKP